MKRFALVVGLGLLCAAGLVSYGATARVGNGGLDPSASAPTLRWHALAQTAGAADATSSSDPADAEAVLYTEEPVVVAGRLELLQHDFSGLRYRLSFASFKPPMELGSIADTPRLIRSTFGLTGIVEGEQLQPSMGAFDLASPVFSSVDGLMSGWLPDVGRLALWAVFTAVVSMALYRLTSNQPRLAANKAEVAALRRSLADFDGPFAEVWPLLRRNFALAGRQLWLTFVPAVIASVPVIFVLVWVSNAFDARLPEAGDRIEVAATASEGRELPPLQWQGDAEVAETRDGAWQIAWPGENRSARLVEADGTVLLTLPVAEPVGVVHQRRWWNALIGNPAGYLPSPGAVDAVELDLPQPEFLPFGPDWLRGWMPPFFAIVLAFSLLLKIVWRLH